MTIFIKHKCNTGRECIFSSSRRREISEARSIISYLAINDMPCEVPRIAEVYMMKKMRRRVGKILNSVEITSLGGLQCL